MSERKKERERQYRIDHKEELATKRKLYYQSKQDHIREYQHQYRLEHFEKISLRAQEYYEKNGDAMNARAKARRQPGVMHRALMKEFKSKYFPWHEGQVKGIYQVYFV